jgi:hypothetical protein
MKYLDPDKIIFESYWQIVGQEKIWSTSQGKYINPSEMISGRVTLRADSEQYVTEYLGAFGIPGPVPPNATDRERLAAAETIIDLLLMEGE